MSERLLESDYFTVDLSSLFKKDNSEDTANDTQKETNTTDADEPSTENTASDASSNTNDNQKKQKTAKPAKVDWAKELERRLAENEALDPETRETEGAVENKFWDDYFADPAWDPEVAKIASTIKLLKKDIKALGFDPKRNAMLAFFMKNKWAKENLIKPGYIDSSKYAVLHNAISKPRMIADSELMIKNKYNIIYCRDLYTKQAKDMETYLALQKNSLSPQASFYNEDTQDRNIRIFLKVGQKDVSKSNAKLNKLSDIETILKKSGLSAEVDLGSTTAGNNSGASKTGKSIGRNDLLNIINQLSIRQSQAALQYLGMSTNNKEVLKYMQKGFDLQNPQGTEMVEASFFVAKLLKGASFLDSEAVDYAEKLLERIKSLV